MKHQALFSLQDKSKTKISFICCNFAGLFKGERQNGFEPKKDGCIKEQNKRNKE